MQNPSTAEYPWSPRNLQQGTLITFLNPNARAPEPHGWQVGAVVSTTEFNQSGTPVVVVCPAVPDIPGNQGLINGSSIRAFRNVRKAGGEPVMHYFCPHLCNTLIPWFTQLRPMGVNVPPIGPDRLKQITSAFVNLLSPTDQKLQEQGPWSYGQLSWFLEYPHVDQCVTQPQTVVVMTPRATWDKVGSAIVVKCSSDMSYRGKDFVSVNPGGPFRQSSIIPRSFQLLGPPQRSQAPTNENSRRIERTVLAEVVSHIHGMLDLDAYRQRRGWDDPVISTARARAMTDEFG